MKKIELKVPPVIQVFVSAFLIFLVPRVGVLPEFSFYKDLFSFVLFFLGSLISILGVYEFRKLKTTVNPFFPNKSSRVVVSGIYEFTRNPMYLGFLFWLISLGVYLNKLTSLFVIVGFILYMTYFQIIPEERALVKKFGNDFLVYIEKVRRWL